MHTAYTSYCQLRISISPNMLDLFKITLSVRRNTLIAFKCHQLLDSCRSLLNEHTSFWYIICVKLHLVYKYRPGKRSRLLTRIVAQPTTVYFNFSTPSPDKQREHYSVLLRVEDKTEAVWFGCCVCAWCVGERTQVGTKEAFLLVPSVYLDSCL